MKMCMPHWNTLKEKISNKGLDHLVASSGEIAAAQTADQLRTNEVNPNNFDPLMHAHWGILGNSMRMLERAGINPLYLLGGDPPDGRNDCPVCELNYLHKTSCTNPLCTLDKETGYDWMLDRAVGDAFDRAVELKLIGKQS